MIMEDGALSTPRLILRHWNDEDAPDLFRMAADPGVGETAGWASHGSVEDSLSAIRTILSGPGVLAIASRATGRPVGCIELDRDPKILRKGPRDAAVSYWIGIDHWNRGYATEALEAVLDHAFSTGVSKVWAQSREDNPPSIRVLEKCGFSFDHRGVFENVHGEEVVALVYRISRKDRQKR